MTDQWTDRLSDYLDGELTSTEWMAMERHLRECAECAATLAELRRVVHRARQLPDRPPARDLWPGIAARIGAGAASRPRTDVVPLAERRPARRRWSFSLPQLAAAGIALAAIAGGGGWLAGTALQSDGVRVVVTPPPPMPPAPRAVRAAIDPAALPHAIGTYDAAVADLQRVLEQGRGRLDTATVRVLEENLRVIDAAIAQAERAVAADPANAYLTTHLVQTMQRKLQLLRQAAALASAVS